jgi:putative DNA primase/helicase
LIDGKILYVFSTNTEFEPECGYTIFAVYAILEHGGDFRAAAKDLAAHGYGDQKAHISQSQDQWQDPQPLPDGLPPVPEFEPLLLPESFRDWLTDVADRYQCPLDYLAVGAMVALSGLVGTKFSIRPKRKDDWPVTPNLWGAVVGPPGVMKTPALNEAIGPLKRLEVQAQERYRQESDQYEQDKQIYQALKTERDKEIKKAHREGKDPSEILAKYKPPEEPTHRRYLINDTTVEALAEILQENPEGTCAYRDELIGLLKMLDKEGQEHARAFYLEAWNGNDSYSSDRIGRGHIHIPQCCLSLLGGIQPGRLQSYVMEAVKGGAGDDGLIQRFQLLVWPDISKDWKDVDRWPDTEAKNRAFVAFDSLDLRPPENFSFRFDDDAQDLFREWRTKLELKIRAGEDHPAIEAHLAKYRSLVPSLALLIALADNPHLEEKVPLGAVEQAAAWAEYLEAHARRLYSAVTRSDTLAAEALAKKIREGDVEDGITLRALRRKNWSRLDDYDLLKDAVGLLEDLNWLRYEKEQSNGRPKTVIRINPSLLKKMTPPKVRTDKSDKRP